MSFCESSSVEELYIFSVNRTSKCPWVCRSLLGCVAGFYAPTPPHPLYGLPGLLPYERELTMPVWLVGLFLLQQAKQAFYCR